MINYQKNMTKDLIKKAVSLAEKEAQEKEINRIKKIVQKYLEKIAEKTKEKKEIEEDLRILKKDLDDIKSGRLDKIEERQAKDKRAHRISLITVHRIDKDYVPMKPRWSYYDVAWNEAVSQYCSAPGLQGGPTTCVNDEITLYGNTCSSFSSGTYNVNGHIVYF